MKSRFLQVLSFFTFPAIVFFVNLFLDYFLNIYDVFPWLDIPMHFIGGVSVGFMLILFLRFWSKNDLLKINSKLIAVLVVVGAVSLIAVLWEFWEYYFSFTIGWKYVYSLEDTLLDLFMGMLGGLGIGVFSKI